MSTNLPVLYESLRQSWLRSVRAANRSPKTVKIYNTAASALIDFMAETHPTVAPAGMLREHVEEFIETYSKERAPATVSLTYRALQQWFNWLLDEGEIDANPTARMQAPMIPEKLVPVLTDDELRALLASCAGRRLVDRRDTALFRLLIDTGGRLDEIARIEVQNIDLDAGTVEVVGKGRRPRILPFGLKTAEALDRYLRVRKADKHADSPGLWLGEKGKGPLTPNGVYQLVRRRGAAIGLPGLHPHMFRHTFADRWLDGGGNEGDLMQIAGWKSRQMLGRYGASAAGRRAREAHKRLGLGDQL